MDLSHGSTFSTSAFAGAEAEMSSRRLSPGRDPKACVLRLIHPWKHPLHEELTVKINMRGSHEEATSTESAGGETSRLTHYLTCIQGRGL